MKAKIWLSVVVAISLFVVYSLGYRSGYKQAFKGRVFHGRDSADIPGYASTMNTGVYDPYFVRVNTIPGQKK